MIRYTTGNLLEADAEALVNTVNTVGIMGKGIALMFKEAFPDNFRAYEAACKRHEVRIGAMFVTERRDMYGPRWIVNFPTKEHWRGKSRVEWIEAGLSDLKRFLVDNHVRSVALPPLGAGNGGLEWREVRPKIAEALGDLSGVEVLVYEPTPTYQNVAKRTGVEKLTPARALIAEIVRRYGVLGIECTMLEVQKLAWFIETAIADLGLPNPMNLQFKANRFGPYADSLRHVLDGLDGSYLHSDKRIGDAKPFDVVRFADEKRTVVAAYMTTPEARIFRPALERTAALIDGFESPLGMELLATVDWLIRREHVAPDREAILAGVRRWPGGAAAARRKAALFEPRLVDLALRRLVPGPAGERGQGT